MTDSTEISGRYLPSGDEAGSPPGDRGFRPDIEGLRAVAIVLVVLFHVGYLPLRGGLIGVDVFFVISGFVITGLLLREADQGDGIKFSAFYARRARRILPAAITVILFSLFSTWVLTNHRTTVLVASDSRWAALFLGNFRFSTVIPTIISRHPINLNHFWSLAVEEQFYLFYPALIALLIAIPGGWSLRRRLSASLAIVVLVSFLASVISSRAGYLSSYDLPFSRVWELAVGCLVALGTTYFRRIPKPIAALMTWVGLVGIVVAAMTFSFRLAYPGYAAALPVLSAALVIAGGATVTPGGAEVMLHLPPFKWIGRWSYSLYLWQPIVFVLASQIARKPLRTFPVHTNLVLALVSVAVAAGSYFWIENPIRHSERLAASPKATLIGAALLMLSCVAITFAF